MRTCPDDWGMSRERCSAPVLAHAGCSLCTVCASARDGSTRALLARSAHRLSVRAAVRPVP
eukprot:3192925-Prymnesium_polylepis.1